MLCLVALLLGGCSATRYVPQDDNLLRHNKLTFENLKGIPTAEKVDKGAIEAYIQQRPNRRLLGMGIYLGFYNITDSSKHNGWHRFWGEKIGEPPVILDSSLIKKTKYEIALYLSSKGYLNAFVEDSVSVNKRRKATVYYNVRQRQPYTIASIDYNITDKFVGSLIMQDTTKSLIKIGGVYDRTTFENERRRITNDLRDIGFWGFGVNFISFSVDSTLGNNRIAVTMNVRQRVEKIGTDGVAVMSNSPIYRISQIVVNSDYDPSLSIAQTDSVRYDTMLYRGIEILYRKKMYIKPEVLIRAIRLSPNELYDQAGLQRTYENVRALGYNANVLFTPITPSDDQSPTIVTIAGNQGEQVTTVEQGLICNIQCTPNIRQSFLSELELSTTADYYSAALTLGYQNRNIFGGAETFDVNFRGAYELMKNKGNRNSFEFGVSTSLTIPRFLLPMSHDFQSRFKQAATKLSLSYDIQQRPDYHRTLFGGTFGYSWTLKNSARFSINPIDINVVYVPWVDQQFLSTIENPYLRNSYTSQLIAGISATYYYNTNSDVKKSGFTFRVTGDANGNLIRGLTSLWSNPLTTGDESYYTLFGLRFAQYARLSFDVSNRVNIGDYSQIAWRFLIAGGFAYGNSNTVPFERLFFAGGSNSMRGWQVRTLGPGSVPLDTMSSYPNQLGDLRIEANFEYRVNVAGGFSMALFLDGGNIWMNSAGERREQARFRFNNFYKQLALNTGVGLRYNLDFFILRLDWGFKLHNPNMPPSQRWFTNLGIGDTALHFAIGLPF